MFPTLLAIPILLLALMLQTVLLPTVPLLSGYADLILVILVAWALQDRVKHAWLWTLIAGAMMAAVSALPPYLPITGYLLVTLIARLVRRRIWQTPILAMFGVTFVGSLVSQILILAVLYVQGTPFKLLDCLNLVILPGTLLNLLLALPVHALIVDLARWVYPEEVEI